MEKKLISYETLYVINGNLSEEEMKEIVAKFSALVSDRCPNLLAAGGLVAAEPDPFASIRVQAQCMATGQAAGVAAAAAARGGAPVQALDRIAIRHQLEVAGAIISFWKTGECQ